MTHRGKFRITSHNAESGESLLERIVHPDAKVQEVTSGASLITITTNDPSLAALLTVGKKVFVDVMVANGDPEPIKP